MSSRSWAGGCPLPTPASLSRRTSLAAGTQWEAGGDPAADLSGLVQTSGQAGGQSQGCPASPPHTHTPALGSNCLSVEWTSLHPHLSSFSDSKEAQGPFSALPHCRPSPYPSLPGFLLVPGPLTPLVSFSPLLCLLPIPWPFPASQLCSPGITHLWGSLLPPSLSNPTPQPRPGGTESGASVGSTEPCDPSVNQRGSGGCWGPQEGLLGTQMRVTLLAK